VDFGAAALIAYLIHEPVYQKDAAPVLRMNVLLIGGAGNARWIETLPRIAYYDQDPAGIVEVHAAFDVLRRITLASVQDRVGQRFAHGHFDLEFFSVGSSGLAHDSQYGIDGA